MSNATISQIRVGSTTYDICDATARDTIRDGLNSWILFAEFTNPNSQTINTMSTTASPAYIYFNTLTDEYQELFDTNDWISYFTNYNKVGITSIHTANTTPNKLDIVRFGNPATYNNGFYIAVRNLTGSAITVPAKAYTITGIFIKKHS